MRRITIRLEKGITAAMTMVMLRLSSIPVPDYPLPEGFYIERSRKGQEKDWAQLEYSVEEFDSPQKALHHYYREFGTRQDLFRERCFFLYKNGDEIIGTAIAWQDTDFFHALTGRLHWVSIRPDHQNRGLVRPLLSRVLTELGYHQDIVYLTVSALNFRAISLYADFGFVPFIPNRNYLRLWEMVSGLYVHPALPAYIRKNYDITLGVFERQIDMKSILQLVLE